MVPIPKRVTQESEAFFVAILNTPALVQKKKDVTSQRGGFDQLACHCEQFPH
jgi:hypothetical protein